MRVGSCLKPSSPLIKESHPGAKLTLIYRYWRLSSSNGCARCHEKYHFIRLPKVTGRLGLDNILRCQPAHPNEDYS